ncbi:MAG: M48 family metallopeptidase [Elusimicrobiota bacterium]|nr:M48 family metallopeptidase [Elusimicrobiota bacterium]
MRNYIFIVLLSSVLAGCSTVPYTHRRQFNIVSDAEENKMGLQAYQETLAKAKLSSDAQASAMVERIGTRIAAAAEQPSFDWQFKLIDEPKSVNAFCLPGGRVAVYTGILPVTENEDGLAVVMAHEVAHALAHHGAERISQGELVSLGGAALQAGMAQKDPAVQKQVMTAFGLGANVGVLLPFSRSHEAEADHIGLILMAKAGYDPRAAVPFWQRMEQAGGQKPPEFLSTHPSDKTRIEKIQAELPEALKYYKPR